MSPPYERPAPEPNQPADFIIVPEFRLTKCADCQHYGNQSGNIQTCNHPRMIEDRGTSPMARTITNPCRILVSCPLRFGAKYQHNHFAGGSNE